MLLLSRTTAIHYGFVALTAVVGLVVTLWLAYTQHQATEIKLSEQFKIAANDRINVISHAIQNTTTVSHSVASFFQASDQVSRNEFSTFTSHILEEYSYIEALEWAPRVIGNQRKIYETIAREAVPDFSFRDIGPNNQLAPAKMRDTYYPILYIEPFADYTARVFGVDFMTQPVRRQAMERAISTNQTSATSPVTLLSSGQAGILFFSPVMKNNGLEGFVVSAVPFQTLVTEAIEPLNKEGVNIIAYDVTPTDEKPQLLFLHASRLTKATNEDVIKIFHSDVMRVQTTMDVAGRKWQVTVVPSKGFFATTNQNSIILILPGIVFTTMLVYYMITRIQENVRIKDIVKIRTQELEQLARYDQLTGLANRRLFLELLKQALARADRSKTKVGVMYIDLNDFKPVNDKCGHAVGDALLKAFGERFQKELRVYDTMARLGGDEFAILLDNIQDAVNCETLLNRLLAVINDPYMILGHEVNVGASIGIAVYPDHAHTLDNFIAAADSAMYAAKKDKSKPYIFFKAED